MLENNDLDKIFGEGLSRTRKFHNAETQWDEVSSRLNRKRKSKWLWTLPFLAMGILFASYSLGLKESSQIDNSRITQLQDVAALESKSNYNSPEVKEEIILNTDIEESEEIPKKIASPEKKTKREANIKEPRNNVQNQLQKENDSQSTECNCDTLTFCKPSAIKSECR